MTFRNMAATTALTFSVAFAPAHADIGNNYVGISAGQATVDDACEGAGSIDCDDSALALGFYGGTHLYEFISLEAGYRYIDDVEASASINGVSAAAGVNAHMLDATVLLGTSNEEKFRVFTKLGLLAWRLNTTVSATNGFSSFSDEDSETGVAVRTGLGASLSLTEQVSVRLDWDYLVDVGDEDTTGESDIHVFSAGPVFRF